jgi:Raf kinase inhibitor-like YbhB/YbcL family protein
VVRDPDSGRALKEVPADRAQQTISVGIWKRIDVPAAGSGAAGPKGFGLTSTAFTDRAAFPRASVSPKVVVNGRSIGLGVSPPLEWHNPPARTMSFALLMDDVSVTPGPDAPDGIWTHWVVYNIPATTSKRPAGAGNPPPPNLPFRVAALPNGALQGVNSNGEPGYLGPNPPRGERHTYVFTLYALDTAQLTQGPGSRIPLAAGATKQELVTAMQGRILARASIQATFRVPGVERPEAVQQPDGQRPAAGAERRPG